MSSREDSSAESPNVATSGSPSCCGSASTEAADSPSPAAASSTRRKRALERIGRADVGEAPEPVEPAVRARRWPRAPA